MGWFDNDEKFKKLKALRESGYKGPVDQDGNAVASRTDGKGTPLGLFGGGDGKGTKDEKRARGLFR